MIFERDLIESVIFLAAALAGGGLLLHLAVRWRYAAVVGRARRIAARLRDPATTLVAVDEQASAIEELAQLPDVNAAVTAARELLGSKDAAVRSAGIEILRRSRSLDRWAHDLRRGGYRAKLRAIEALGEVGDERAVEELIEALGDDDPDVARQASYAVLERDRDYASDRLADALSSPDRRIAETAAATLVHMGEEAVEALVSQLASLSPQARRLAVESLGAIGLSDLGEVLLPLLEVDPDGEVRTAAARAIAHMGGDDVVTHLRRVAVSDPDWFVRARAFSLLGEVNAPGASEVLMEGLAEVQSYIASCVMDDEDVEPVLEGSQRIRSAIIAGLRMLGLTDEEITAAEREAAGAQFDSDVVPEGEQTAEAVSENIRALSDRDAVRRAEAARGLAEAGRSAVAVLARALRDPDPLVRGEAARSLGRLGVRDCLEALAKCLADPDANVRLAASTAMRAIVTRDAARELSD